MIDFTLDEKRRLCQAMGCLINEDWFGSMVEGSWPIADFDPEGNPAHMLLCIERLRIGLDPSIRKTWTAFVGDAPPFEDVEGEADTIGEAVAAVCKKLIERKG